MKNPVFIKTKAYVVLRLNITVCPRSLVSFFIVTYCKLEVKNSWTYSMLKHYSFFLNFRLTFVHTGKSRNFTRNIFLIWTRVIIYFIVHWLSRRLMSYCTYVIHKKFFFCHNCFMFSTLQTYVTLISIFISLGIILYTGNILNIADYIESRWYCHSTTVQLLREAATKNNGLFYWPGL